jgi:hypothetical protein
VSRTNAPVRVQIVPWGEKGPVCGRCKRPLVGTGLVRTLGVIGATCDPCYQEIRREVSQIIADAIANGTHSVPDARRRPTNPCA